MYEYKLDLNANKKRRFTPKLRHKFQAFIFKKVIEINNPIFLCLINDLILIKKRLNIKSCY